MSTLCGELLSNIAIFQGQDCADLDRISAEMTQREYKAGEMVFREGDPGDELFIVIKGAVAIFVTDQEGKEVVLAEVRAGSYFGEMSIIDQSPRSAACRVLEDGVFLAFHADSFRRISHTMPVSAVRIMNLMLTIIVERLMKTGAFVTQMVQWGEQSRTRAITDPATGLFNRRYLEESLESLVSRAKTEGKRLSFVMFDMDRFGSLNAKYGQEFCDGLIVTSSKVFREVFSNNDILVRFGGDEFIFIFPGAGPDEAQKKCDALCAAIAALTFPGKDELRLSCSMGFATLPDNASGTEELKERSDKALYFAKERGRGRAVGWEG
jgi:diguanylate cyclase (GGDEF)-like protein